MIYKKVESYAETRPPEIDTESSKTKVYLRRNITEVPNSEQEGTETGGTHWLMEEAELTKDEYRRYLEQIESPALDLVMQQINDITANQELGDITVETNHEEQMQLLNDIQADIQLIGLEE
ncbi:MAG: hypothetical protein IJ641_05705 [Lachnospiraceae bacterium]|nr:hypothetical protein [Lachnospiraceae bacterium]